MIALLVTLILGGLAACGEERTSRAPETQASPNRRPSEAHVPALNLSGPPEPGVGNGTLVNLYVMSSDGSNVKALTSAPDYLGTPVWSPDGTRIAFSGPGGIEVINADGSGLTQLTRTPEPALGDTSPAWAPDGTRIAFTRGMADEHSDIYVINADGTNLKRLTDHPATDGQPAWSSDGTQIVFASRRESQFEQLFVMKADGSEVIPVTETDIPVVYAAERGGNTDIYTANVGGTGVRRLTYDPARDSSPAFSPDGTRIAFFSDRGGEDDIYMMKADGTGQINVTKNQALELDLAWSPDGTRVAFSRLPDGNYEIYLMNPDGFNQTRLSAENDHSPAWSPDGTRITFLRSAD